MASSGYEMEWVGMFACEVSYHWISLHSYKAPAQITVVFEILLIAGDLCMFLTKSEKIIKSFYIAQYSDQWDHRNH